MGVTFPESRPLLRALCGGAAAFVLAFATGAAAQTAPSERPATFDLLVANFETMLYPEGPTTDWATFQRWTGPVRAVVVGETGEQVRPQLRALFDQFEALTGIAFSFATADSGPSLQLVFSRRDLYRNAIAKSFPRPELVVCFSNTRLDRRGAIVSATAVIPDDLPTGLVAECMAHELMHAIGFQGHPAPTFNSALRNGRGPRELTINDKILIRTLYDPALRIGMTRDEVMMACRPIIAGLLDGVARSADPMAVLAQGGVSNWWIRDDATATAHVPAPGAGGV